MSLLLFIGLLGNIESSC